MLNQQIYRDKIVFTKEFTNYDHTPPNSRLQFSFQFGIQVRFTDKKGKKLFLCFQFVYIVFSSCVCVKPHTPHCVNLSST